MFEVGDVIRYQEPIISNDIPGLVVSIRYKKNGERDCLQVQWFDWSPGTLAQEDEACLELVSKAIREK